MKKEMISILSYILPLITFIIAFIYFLYWYFNLEVHNIWYYGGAISGVVCSLFGMLLVRVLNLNIGKHWSIYLISIAVALIIEIPLLFGFSYTLFLDFVSFIILIIIEYNILNRKVISFVEKIILLMINPVNHFWVLSACVGIKISLYGVD